MSFKVKGHCNQISNECGGSFSQHIHQSSYVSESPESLCSADFLYTMSRFAYLMNLFNVHGKWGETFISNDNFWLGDMNQISYLLALDCFGYSTVAPSPRDHFEFILWITNILLVLWLKWGADFLDPSNFQVSIPFLLLQLWTLKEALVYWHPLLFASRSTLSWTLPVTQEGFLLISATFDFLSFLGL